jgi:hypothetical protein
MPETEQQVPDRRRMSAGDLRRLKRLGTFLSPYRRHMLAR